MTTRPGNAPTLHPFTLRLALGLLGVWIAALTSGLNDRVSDIALADIVPRWASATTRVAGLFLFIRPPKSPP